MNVRECYEAIDGDYEEVKRRFLTDARIRRFALLFLRDSSMEELRAAMRDQDCEKAFQAAHTLKGVCLNLGFSGLYKPVNIITVYRFLKSWPCIASKNAFCCSSVSGCTSSLIIFGTVTL